MKFSSQKSVKQTTRMFQNECWWKTPLTLVPTGRRRRNRAPGRAAGRPGPGSGSRWAGRPPRAPASPASCRPCWWWCWAASCTCRPPAGRRFARGRPSPTRRCCTPWSASAQEKLDFIDNRILIKLRLYVKMYFNASRKNSIFQPFLKNKVNCLKNLGPT